MNKNLKKELGKPSKTIRRRIKQKEDEIKFKHGELRRIILGILGASVLIGGTFLITPNFPIVYGTILKLFEEVKETKAGKKKVKRVLKNLEDKEIIRLEEKNGEVYVYLKDWLSPKIVKYSLQMILNLKKKEKKWSGKWFLVVFDVPEVQRNKRDYLRKFLRDIGFYPYQQSIYVFPYECEKEISLIKKIVEGGKYMSYIVAEKIDNEKQIKIFFGLV